MRKRTARPRGMTLIEILIAASVLSVVMVPVLGIMGFLSHQWGSQIGRGKAIQSADLALDLMTREISKSGLFTPVLGGRKNVFTLPANTDAQGNYVPVYQNGQLVYLNGKTVSYYLSDTSGVNGANGSVLWRGYNNGGQWQADTTWSLQPGNANLGRIPNVTALAFTTTGMPSNTVRVSLTVTVSEGKQTSSYTVRRDVYLSNHN